MSNHFPGSIRLTFQLCQSPLKNNIIKRSCFPSSSTCSPSVISVVLPAYASWLFLFFLHIYSTTTSSLPPDWTVAAQEALLFLHVIILFIYTSFLPLIYSHYLSMHLLLSQKNRTSIWSDKISEIMLQMFQLHLLPLHCKY